MTAPASLVAGNLTLASANSPVHITLAGRGDLGAVNEYVAVTMNGTLLETPLFQFGGLDCPSTTESDTLTITAELFNELLSSASGVVAITATGSFLVSAAECPASIMRVGLRYSTDNSDCNGNGVSDTVDIASSGELDCNTNGVPDACDLAAGTEPDCDSNGVPDSCDEDKNLNGVPDQCDFNRGDLDLSGLVNAFDLAIMLSVWGTPGPLGDLNHDGIVNGGDLGVLLVNWGT